MQTEVLGHNASPQDRWTGFPCQGRHIPGGRAGMRRSIVPESKHDRNLPQGRVLKIEFLLQLPNASNIEAITEWVNYNLGTGSMLISNPLSAFDLEVLRDVCITDTGLRNIVTERVKPDAPEVILRRSVFKFDSIP